VARQRCAALACVSVFASLVSLSTAWRRDRGPGAGGLCFAFASAATQPERPQAHCASGVGDGERTVRVRRRQRSGRRIRCVAPDAGHRKCTRRPREAGRHARRPGTASPMGGGCAVCVSERRLELEGRRVEASAVREQRRALAREAALARLQARDATREQRAQIREARALSRVEARDARLAARAEARAERQRARTGATAGLRRATGARELSNYS
jgi:hypothetical protein